MTTVTAEFAGCEAPDAFVAVTATRTVCPTSPAASTYVCPVPDEASGWQVAPELSQRCHWYAYEVGEPDQVPVVADKVCPCPARPDTVGGEVLVGTAAPDDPNTCASQKEIPHWVARVTPSTRT